MPPTTTKKTSINKDSRLQPYSKKSKAPDMSSPTSPTTHTAAGPWQPEDDAQLVEARKQSLNWSDISQQHFPTKTPNACRKRHERLMDKRHTTEDWEATKLADMAAAYVELRERMWRILAQEIGEKWQVVETKVSLNNSSPCFDIDSGILVYGEGCQELDKFRSNRWPS